MTQNCQSNPEEKEQSWRHNPYSIQTIPKAAVINTAWHWHKKQTHRSVEQNGEPRNKPNTYRQLIFKKGGKNIQWRKDSLFSKWCWESWTVACKSMKLEPSLTPYTK